VELLEVLFNRNWPCRTALLQVQSTAVLGLRPYSAIRRGVGLGYTDDDRMTYSRQTSVLMCQSDQDGTPDTRVSWCSTA